MHENDSLDRLRFNQFSDLQWNLKQDLNYLAQLPVYVFGEFLQTMIILLYYMYYQTMIILLYYMYYH